MDAYILKSAACLGVLFLFYKLVLENSTLHTTKRFYLLGSVVVSAIIPLVTFTEYVVTSSIPYTLNLTTSMPQVEGLETTTLSDYIPFVVGICYGIGVLFFGYRFIKNLEALLRRIRTNEAVKDRSILYILVPLPITPHSFFHYIFFNKKDYEANKIPQEVIYHERAHVEQKHSWDIVFIELVRIVFWFNPLLYLIKDSIKLNHEFLADRSVLRTGAELATYQSILLDFSSTSSVPTMAHSINYSSFKKRFTVMKTHTSKRAAWSKGVMILPLLALLTYGFSSTETIVKEEKITNSPSIVETKDSLTTKRNSNSLSEASSVKATPEQIIQYNTLAAFWNIKFSETSDNKNMPLSELEKLETIYRVMSKQQKKVAEPFPACSLTNDKSSNTSSSVHNAFQEKPFHIVIHNSNVSINGNSSSLATFTKDIDKLTNGWDKSDFLDTRPTIKIGSTPTTFLTKLDVAYKKTKYSKINGGLGIIPPPPPPAPNAPSALVAPKVRKGVDDIDPGIPPPPPVAPKVKGDYSKVPDLPPPPPPISREQHIKVMQEKGAQFFYENTEINGAKALKLVRENSDLNLSIESNSSLKPIVKISKKGYRH